VIILRKILEELNFIEGIVLMKIKALVILLLLILSNIGVAAPIVDLEEGQSVLGVMMQGGDFNSSFFGESQVGSSVSLGVQVGFNSNSSSLSDFYLQYKLASELGMPVKLIIGNKSYNSKSGYYVGAAISTQLSETIDGYASISLGSGFQDYQVGTNYALSDNAILNLNYRIFKYDELKSGLGLGIMCKF
jgi:hypothetical protein